MLTSFLVTVAGLATAAGGLWIAALFVPSVALTVKSAFDFLRSPLGTVLGILALAIGLYVVGWIGGDIHGSQATRAAWSADVLQKKKAADAREAALHIKIKQFVDAEKKADDAFTQKIDGRVKTYEAEIPARAACRATADDVRRLLSIH